MDSIQKRIDDFLMVQVATFERKNRGRAYGDLRVERNTMAHKWDSLCGELLKAIPHGAYRNEVESRLVTAGYVVTEWWDYGFNVTANELAEFLDKLRAHADAIHRILGDGAGVEGHGAFSQADLKAHLSCADLAGKFGVSPDALKKRLEKWRRDHDEGWIEVEQDRKNAPRILYRLGAVKSILDEMAIPHG